MGNYATSYIGPYLEIVGQPVTRSRSNCSKTACPKPDTGFCSMCGMDSKHRVSTWQELSPPEQKLTEEQDGDPEVDDVAWMESEDFHDRLCEGTEDKTICEGTEDKTIGANIHRVLVSNVSGPGRSWDKYDHTEGAYEITPQQIERELTWFHTEFADEISRLRGTETGRPLFPVVEVRWGLVLGYS